MSLPRDSVHVRITPDLHKQLKIYAEMEHKPVAEVAALWLEKMIVAETHELRIAAQKMSRLGLIGSVGEGEG